MEWIIGTVAIFAVGILWLIYEAKRAPLLRQDEDGNWVADEDGD
jgi:hypothetical protein